MVADAEEIGEGDWFGTDVDSDKGVGVYPLCVEVAELFG